MTTKNKSTVTKIFPKQKTQSATTKKENTVSPELQEMVYAQLTDRRFAPVEHSTLEKPVTYVTARNGLFKVTKTPIGLFKEELQSFKDPVYGLPDMEPGVDLAIPKIPFKYMVEALTYYRDINAKDKTEASILYFWNDKNIEIPEMPGLRQDGQLIIYCPEQINSATLSEFGDDEFVNWLRDNTALLLETHSHNTMNSFFSGTDDANENMTQFYAVWGKVASDEPQFSFRYVVGDTKEECSPSMLIDWPTVERTRTTIIQETVSLEGDLSMIDINLKDSTFTQEKEPVIEEFEPELVKGPFVRVEYPADWMNQHSKRTYTPKKKSYFGGNQYYEYKKKEFGGNYNQTSLDLGDDSFGSEDATYPYSGRYADYDEYLHDYYGKQTEEDYLEEDYLEEEDITMYSHNGESPSERLTIFLEQVVFDVVEDKDTIKKFIY